MGRHRAAPRLEHMSEKEIQELEGLTPEQLELLISKLGAGKTGELITALLRSYRVSTHAAHAAWTVVQESEKGDISVASFRALRKALHLYAPLNFLPFREDIEFAAVVVESIYNTLESWDFSGPQAMLDFAEYLYDRIVQLRARPAVEG